jgi:uncharacterized membrane protein
MTGAPSTQRTRLPVGPMLLIFAVSVSLHVVPQALAHRIDPSWTMAALLLIDALIVAALTRTLGAVRSVLLLTALLALVVLTRQQQFVALPSLLLNLTLAGVFGWTLRRDEVPLTLRIARHAYPQDMTPAFERYLRRLTQAWALFFLAMAATTVLLALFAPFAWWSLFANILSWLLMAAMFLGEYAVRRLFFPHLPPHTPLQTLTSTMAFGIGRRAAASAPSAE